MQGLSTGETRREQCSTHGEFEARHIIGQRFTGCPTCRDEQGAEHRRAMERQREVERQQALAQMVATSGLRGRFLESSFDTFNAATDAQRRALAVCRSFVYDLGNAWGAPWLLGPVGTGKTHLLAAMVSATVWQRGKRARYTTARGLILRLRATWRRDAEESEAAAIEELARVPLLLLDEVGVGFGSEAEITQLFDVIDARYQLRRPVVIASNLSAPEIRTLLGDRLFDRLREGATVIPCDWESYRGRG